MTSTVAVWAVLLCIFIQNSVRCEKHLLFKNFGMCDKGVEYPSKVYTTFYTKNGTQHVTGNLTFSQDFGDNIMVYFKLFLFSPVTNQYREVFSGKEKFCTMIRTYMGPFLDELEKRAQILPGSCPIVKGKYQVADFALNTNKLTIKNIAPLGKLKITCENTEIKTGKIILCYELECEIS